MAVVNANTFPGCCWLHGVCVLHPEPQLQSLPLCGNAEYEETNQCCCWILGRFERMEVEK